MEFIAVDEVSQKTEQSFVQVKAKRSTGKTLSPAGKKKLGAYGESFAARVLVSQRYQILDCNWRYGRYGEIDLIALSPEDELVFVEVKTRKSTRFGQAVEALGIRQQKKLLMLAEAYTLGHPQYANLKQRIDLFCVIPTPGKSIPAFRHIVNALDSDAIDFSQN